MFEIFFRSRILLNKKREADASLFLLSRKLLTASP